MAIGVLFVCMGNICRSPTAEGVFTAMARDAGFATRLRIDSAGTHDYHPGASPDPRSREEARRRGYDLGGQSARVVVDADFADYEYVLAMDRGNFSELSRRCPDRYRDRLKLFLSFAPELGEQEVPDPYYGGGQGFEIVLDMVEAASRGLLAHLAERLEEAT